MRVCPNPTPWNNAYQRLVAFSRRVPCEPANPPVPLILNGWVYSNDANKKERWTKTIEWAEQNRCSEILQSVPDSDFYFVDELTAYAIGPLGGPMYRDWDHETKPRPSDEELLRLLAILKKDWLSIVGVNLSNITAPVKFTGRKARRLLVQVIRPIRPPWGDWDKLTGDRGVRSEFTKFRRAINRALSPHEVDHIDFRLTGEREMGDE
jgi:hypothetical protein